MFILQNYAKFIIMQKKLDKKRLYTQNIHFCNAKMNILYGFSQIMMVFK